MTPAEQARNAEAFRNRHRGRSLLLLPNAWDAMSARIFADAGFDAIVTTSGGLAWSLGYTDGERTPQTGRFDALAPTMSGRRTKAVQRCLN